MYSSNVPSDLTTSEIIFLMYGPEELLRQQVVLTELLIEAGIIE